MIWIGCLFLDKTKGFAMFQIAGIGIGWQVCPILMLRAAPNMFADQAQFVAFSDMCHIVLVCLGAFA